MWLLVLQGEAMPRQWEEGQEEENKMQMGMVEKEEELKSLLDRINCLVIAYKTPLVQIE